MHARIRVFFWEKLSDFALLGADFRSDQREGRSACVTLFYVSVLICLLPGGFPFMFDHFLRLFCWRRTVGFQTDVTGVITWQSQSMSGWRSTPVFPPIDFKANTKIKGIRLILLLQNVPSLRQRDNQMRANTFPLPSILFAVAHKMEGKGKVGDESNFSGILRSNLSWRSIFTLNGKNS